MTERGNEFHSEYQGVAGHHFLAELDVVDVQEVGAVRFGILLVMQDEYASGLCHRLYQQDAGHDRLAWEVSLEEGFVARHVLDSHDAVLLDVDDLIDQLHGITVRKEFPYARNIHQGRHVRVVLGCLHLMTAYFPPHHAREHIIYSVSWSGGNDASLDGFAYERHIANDVEQFVTRRFVIPNERFVLDVAKVVGIVMLSSGQLAELVEVLLRCLTFVDDNGVVEVAAFDKPCQEQLLYLTHKHEGAGCSNLCCELVHAVECRELAAEHLAVEGNHACNREVIVGQQRDASSRLVVSELHLLGDVVVVLRRVLFADADSLYLTHERFRAAIKDGKLRTVHLHQHIVDA